MRHASHPHVREQQQGRRRHRLRRAVWRIIAAAAISANLIHQGKKQLRIIIDRLMEAGREGVMAEFI